MQIAGEVIPGGRVARLDERGEVVEAGGPAFDRPSEQVREAPLRELHLVAQADDRLIEMAPERGADPTFRIREVDQECRRRQALDVARDLGHERNRAQRVGHAARPRVLAEHVLHAVTARDVEVLLPPVVPIDLHRHDHGIGPGKRIGPVSCGADRDAAAGLSLERGRELLHPFERASVEVDEPDGRVREHRVGVEIMERREPERRRAGADQNDVRC